MRFITEFEVSESEWVKPDHLIKSRKDIRALEMGKIISDSFDWQNPVNGNTLHHKLEIEAFPMDKWIEFKQKLGTHINDSCGVISPNYILNLFKELESFGKPSGDTITNPK